MTVRHYLNGRWVGAKDLSISVFDLSVIRGYGVFDFLRTYNNQPFKLDEHIDRLFRSASILGIPIPETKREIKQHVVKGLKLNRQPEKNIRMVVTGGVSDDGVTPGKPSFFIIFTQATNYPASCYQEGVTVMSYPHLRPYYAAKSLNYQAGIVALQKAKKAGAIEALFTGADGELYEGTTSNFFAVINKKLITTRENILQGITRNVVIDLARKKGLEVVEKTVYTRDVENFEEAFITASNKEVMPVTSIDGTPVGGGKVGPVARMLHEAYHAITRGHSLKQRV